MFSAGLYGQTYFDHSYYISNLNSFSYLNPDLAMMSQSPTKWRDQQVHFRWNGYMYYNDNISSQISIRNRIFSGYQTEENINNFEQNISSDVLSFNSISADKYLVNHEIDRLFFQWEKDNWNIRIGRQRVNWGIQNFWNPHDLFNQTNFFDFDYIEKPGTDAIRVQYYPNSNQSIEFALNEDIQGGLYRYNKYKYDFQLLTAKYYNDYCIGFGWAGQLKNIGIKGELSYFKEISQDQHDFVGSIGLDYNFKQGIYISVSCLYKDSSSGVRSFNIYQSEATAKNPMPFTYNFMYHVQFDVYPLVQLGGTLIHDDVFEFVFINPQITFSLRESLDLMVCTQNVWTEVLGKLENNNQILFTRLQWDF